MTDLTALVVDDEPLARSLLTRLLEAQGVAVVGEVGDGESALAMALDLCPALVFLDIEMPGMRGIELAEHLTRTPSPPLIIFVTGYSEHASTAFDLESLDYLLKPVSKTRLAQTLTRAKSRLQNAAPQELTVADLAPLQRLPIRDDYAVHFVRVADILYLESRDRRVVVHTAKGEHKTWYTLKHLEERLPGETFVRVHEAYIVQLDMVEDLFYLGNHAYEIRLSNDRRIPVGRSRYATLQRRLGLTS